MNRFFSKLNLSDIKIKAEGNSFPPDADERDDHAAEVAVDELEPSADAAPVAVIEDSIPVTAEIADPAEERLDVDFSDNGHIHVTSSSDDATVTLEAPSEVDEPLSPTPGVSSTGVTEIVSEDIVFNVGEVLKVSARSRPSAVAGAIAGVVREVGKAEVQAIGAGATNQAIKAVAIARDYLQESGIDAICVPAFIDVTIENEDRTAIRLVVEPR